VGSNSANLGLREQQISARTIGYKQERCLTTEMASKLDFKGSQHCHSLSEYRRSAKTLGSASELMCAAEAAAAAAVDHGLI
jgi:hypothetical protein